jgi:RNA-directed DNA polymerase
MARALAEAFVTGPWLLDDLVERGTRVLRRRDRWLRPLVRRLLASFTPGSRPSAFRVTVFLRSDEGFCEGLDEDPPSVAWLNRLPAVMYPAAGAPRDWHVPEITTPAALAKWLELSDGELGWFAHSEARRRCAADGPLCHYRYRWVAKRSGSARLIEAPKSRLRDIQRRVLDEVLASIPSHDAAHGYRPGRSVRTYVAPHVGKEIVLRIDLSEFFPAISAARIRALFRTSGYPETVANLITGLCTNSAPAAVWKLPGAPSEGVDAQRLRRLYAQPHLPQGAPTSPALANLCAFRLDCRLARLARAADVAYTRYADDLLFSGGPRFAQTIERFSTYACAIALEEGFSVAFRKTRRMRRGARQRAAGLVLNERINVPRDEYDTLKATLFNCTRGDPRQQDRLGRPNFRAHLAGRIAYVASIHPERGRRLMALFDRIAWPDNPRPPAAGSLTTS